MIKKRFISMLVLLAAVVTGAWAQTETLLITINSTSSFTSGSRTFNNIATVTFSSGVYCDDDSDGWYNSGWSNTILSVTPAAGYTITKVKFYCNTGSAFDETSPFEATLNASWMYVNGSSCGTAGVTKIEVYGYAAPATVAVTGVTLAPTSATLTLGETETVTLIPTVLPGDATDKSVTWSSSNTSVATVADGVVTAVAAGEATITVTTTDGAKTATCAVTVAAPAASAYTVTLKEGTEDATSWTITPDEATTTGVAAGTEVKATYGGAKKVKSVKAKKKAPAGPTAYTLAESTVGMIVGSDGKAYAAADKNNLPSGVTVAGLVAYKNGDNGLAIALTDEPNTMDWYDAMDDSGAKAHTPAVTGQTWKLPSYDDIEKMLSSYDNYWGDLNEAIANVGGTGLLDGWDNRYWLSDESEDEARYMMDLSSEEKTGPKDQTYLVRSVIAF